MRSRNIHIDRTLLRILLLAALLSVAFGQANAASECVINPPRGPFEAAMKQLPQPPTAEILPSNPGAWSTLIAPDSRHRWDSKGGLVESLDGSLLLHGVVSGPNSKHGQLHVVVLVDYQPASSAVISVLSPDRNERLGRVDGSRARVDADGAAATFDIELPPLTVAAGTYREIQTLVWFDGGSIDARRWTVYAGPTPPDAIECIAASAEVGEMPTRSQLKSDGRFVMRAPRVATLAVVPFRASGQGSVQFVRIDQVKRGWEGQLGSGVELAAVWEGPFTGPGSNWISSFWSARPTLQ